MLFRSAAGTAHGGQSCVAMSAPNSDSMVEVSLIEGDRLLGQRLTAHVGDLEVSKDIKKGSRVRVVRGDLKGEVSTVKVAVSGDVLLTDFKQEILKIVDVVALWAN